MADAPAAAPADVPDFMMCNIGLCLVEDPVTGVDGKLYSRAALERYVRERGEDPSRAVAPITRSVGRHGRHQLRVGRRGWRQSGTMSRGRTQPG